MKKIIASLFLVSLLIISCSQDFKDPTKPSETEIFKSRDGIIGATNGLQLLWTNTKTSPLYCYVTANGFTTGELQLKNAGNEDESQLNDGEDKLLPRNAIINNLWSKCLVIKAEANKIFANASILNIANEKASVMVTASIYKALALGTIIEFYQEVPLNTMKNSSFNNRTEVLNEAISTLLNAQKYLSNASGINELVKGINYKNTIDALLARYYLMQGDYTNALENASLVDLKVTSTFNFDQIIKNPIFDVSTSGTNVFQPINRSLGLPTSLEPNPNDARIDFYIKPNSNPIMANGFFNANNKPIPVYLPGEMLLIKAEAYARTGNLAKALIELNKVLTKKASDDIYGVGANLPPYSGAMEQASILNEIYKNRCIEMYMSGLKLEDSRRFNRPGPSYPKKTPNDERNRNWYPYPDSERYNNPLTPKDPEI